MSLLGSVLNDENTQSNQALSTNIHTLSDIEVWRYTDEEIIAAALANWPSKAYGHYKTFLRRHFTEDGEPHYIEFRFECRFGCPRHPDYFRARKTKTHSGRLYDSAKRCDQRRQMEANLEGVVSIEPSQEMKEIALLCIQCSHHLISPRSLTIDSLSIIRAQYVRDRVGSPYLPSLVTDNLQVIYPQLAITASRHFQGISEAIHLVVDGWTNHVQTDSLVCTGIVWRSNNKIFRSMMDVAWISDLCSEDFLASFINRCLERFSLIGKIKSICISNAPRSEQVITALHAKSPNVWPNFRALCYPHIVRLMAEALITFLRPPPRITLMKFFELPLEDGRRIDAGLSDLPLDFDLPEQEFNAELIQEAVREAHNKMRVHGLEIESGLLQHASRIMSKVTALEQLMGQVDSRVIRDNYWIYSRQDASGSAAEISAGCPRSLGQWTTTLDSINRYLRFQPTLHNLADAGVDSLNMHKFLLDETQQELLENFQKCFEGFRNLIDLFSRQQTPLLHELVLEFFALRKRLEDVRNDWPGTSLTRVAAEAALSVYRLITKSDEMPEMHAIVVVMHPTLKLQWFEDRGIDTFPIHALLHERFNQNYPLIKREGDEEGLFDLIQAQTDNISTYLRSPVLSEEAVEKQGGLVEYWNKEFKTSPRVARMALDYLTVPASSLDPTRTISGGPICTKGLEKYVDHDTFRAMMCVGSWLGTPVLPDIDALANVLEELPGAES